MVESTEIMVRSTFFPGTIHEHHAKFPRFHGEIPPSFPMFSFMAYPQGAPRCARDLACGTRSAREAQT